MHSLSLFSAGMEPRVFVYARQALYQPRYTSSLKLIPGQEEQIKFSFVVIIVPISQQVGWMLKEDF